MVTQSEPVALLPVPVRLLPRVLMAVEEYRTKPRGGVDRDSDALGAVAAAARDLFLDAQATRHDTARQTATSGVVGAGPQEGDGAALLSLKGVGARLDVSLRTVQRWVSGDGLPVVLVGARRRVRVSDLDEWLERQR